MSIQGKGLWGLSPLWTSKYMDFRGFSGPKGAEPPTSKEKKLTPPRQIPEYAPDLLLQCLQKEWLRINRKNKKTLILFVLADE